MASRRKALVPVLFTSDLHDIAPTSAIITGTRRKRADGASATRDGPRTGCTSFPRPSRRPARLTNSNTSAVDAPTHFFFFPILGHGGHSSRLNAQPTRHGRLSLPSDDSDAVSTACLPLSC